MKVVIVEDESLVAMYMKKVLEKEGHEVLGMFISGEEAIEEIPALKPDLILMDVMLAGDLDGIETAGRIRSLIDLPIIYLTGNDEKLISDRARATEPLWCLLKPFRINELRIAVEMALYKFDSEKKLKESEQKFRFILESMNDGLITLDENENINFVNDQFCTLMEFSREELTGKRLSDFSRHFQWDLSDLSRKPATDIHTYKEIECLTKSGRFLPVLVSSKPLFDSLGAYKGTLGIFISLSELRQAQSALAFAEKKYEVLFANLSDAVIVADAESLRIIEVNKTAAEMYGSPISHLLGVPVNRLSSDPEKAGEIYRTVISSSEHHKFSDSHVSAEGVTFPVEMSLSSFQFGKRHLICAVIRNISEELSRERSLKENRDRIDYLLHSSPTVIVGFAAGKPDITFVSRNVKKLIGYDPDEIVGSNFLRDHVHPDDLDLVTRNISDFEGMPETTIEYRMRSKAGEWRWIRHDGRLVFGENREPLESIGSWQDIHDRKIAQLEAVKLQEELHLLINQRTRQLHETETHLELETLERTAGEQKLRKAEQRYKSLIEAIPAVVFIVNMEGKFDYVGPQSLEIFGIKEDVITGGLTYFDLIHEMDKENVKKAVSTCAKKKEVFFDEFRINRPDGEVKWLLTKAVPVLEQSGELQSFHGVSFDITNRKDTEHTLEVLEQRLTGIFEAARDCIFIKNSDLRYLLANPAFTELFGESVVGKTDYELFRQEDADHTTEVDKRVMAGEVIEEEHTRHIRGVAYTFIDIRTPLRDSAGSIIGICGISRNMTERKRAQVVPETPSVFPSSGMRQVLKYAEIAAKTDSIVLLTGESGVGKDFIARYIHDHSKRSGGPFFSINCGALPHEIAESELFGHEAGAFTGARGRKLGLLELAEGGTLLLNEIGELSIQLQVKLLAFLDTRSFTRVGGEKSVTVNARLIAATNKDLQSEVLENRFRSDLYYRLNVFSIRIPPLRERPDDIAILAKDIIKNLARELQMARIPHFTDRQLHELASYKWPGNIRELKNYLERALILSEGPDIEFVDFINKQPSAAGTPDLELTPGKNLDDFIADLEKQLIRDALTKTGGRKQEAAKLLGISRHTLKRHLKKLHIDTDG